MKKYISISIFILALPILFIFFGQGKKVDFNSEIRPILNQKCIRCHGGVRQQGGLSFLFRTEALKPAKSGAVAIEPGKPAASEMLHRIKHDDPEVRMPPDGDPLNQEEIKLIEKWIKQGAKWEEHWAYIKPDFAISPPENNSDWGHHPIDAFVLEKLKEHKLSPSPRAEKGDLIRRLSLDLTGLPPNEKQVAAFLNDEAPDAYTKLVDKLLASPHFGERWSSMWLDLARYADSKGYQKDHLRPNFWRYRDWVIDAFNQDMPFDQFTIEQLAGDLLEAPDGNQMLATVFHRNTMTNDEGGTDDEEFRVAAVLDRINTTMEVWQASTISCVQCHSHPYDPFKHKEFYQLYSFFNNTEDADLGNDYPLMPLVSPIEERQKKQLKQTLQEYEIKGDTLSENYKAALSAWLDIQPAKLPIMKELPQDSSRKSFLFERGNWLVHGEQVFPEVPESLNPLPENAPKNRLGLAQWLVDKENPLTARVIVNRFWEQLFGLGIVETVEDFGTQGAPPSHPELLDWLAVQLQTDYNWSIKTLLREIVLSATYQQSTQIRPELLEIDPYNRLLARGPRIRLSAEQIRDQALVVSGLFEPEVGGPSVMPYQPEGVWNVIRHVSRWETKDHKDKYRRGLYTFWRRVSPYPSMLTFDTPSREICVSRRIRTNTPLQALVTLNDPVFMEAAEALAQRIEEEGGEAIEEQLEYGYQLAMMRKPGKEKLNALLAFYNKALETYSRDKAASKALIGANQDAHRAALVNVASVLINLDEFIMKS